MQCPTGNRQCLEHINLVGECHMTCRQVTFHVRLLLFCVVHRPLSAGLAMPQVVCTSWHEGGGIAAADCQQLFGFLSRGLCGKALTNFCHLHCSRNCWQHMHGLPKPALGWDIARHDSAAIGKRKKNSSLVVEHVVPCSGLLRGAEG